MIISRSPVLALLAAAVIALVTAAPGAAADAAAPATSQPISAPKVEGGVSWYDPVNWGVEGRGWTEGLARYYDRLPAKAEKTVPGAVWGYSHDSSGMNVRFATNSPEIRVRYRLSSPNLSHGWGDFSNVTGSGIDMYAHVVDPTAGKKIWRWLASNKPVDKNGTDTLVKGLPVDKQGIYLLNLPTYNGVESLEIGVNNGSAFEGLPPRTALPIVFYGTSIMQGGVASRPGLSMAAMVGRNLDRPVINLGFCGCGRMDPEVVALMAEIRAVAYVIDCEPNMTAEEVKQRTEPLVRRLHQAHPETAILLVEQHDYPSPKELQPERNGDTQRVQAALHAAYDRLIKDGEQHLYYLDGHALIGGDGEGTGDGVHPNALGTFRYAEAYTAALKDMCK